MNNIVIFDIDNTIIKGQSQQLLLKYLFKKRKINIFFLLKLYFWFFLYKFSIVKNPLPIMEYSFKLVKDWDINLVDKIINDFFYSTLKKNIYSKIEKIIQKHIKNNDEILIISNTIYPLAKVIAEYLNIKNVFATQLEIKNKKYTGNLYKEIVYSKKKVKVAKKFIRKNHLTLKNSYAYADHLSDLSLLKLVDHPIVVNPNKKFNKIARKKNWKIIKLK